MVAPHNVGGVISTTAALHLMVTLRNQKSLEHFNDFVDKEVKNIGSPYPEVVDGYFMLPKGPGWGVEIDFDFIESNPPATKDGIILDPGLNMFKSENWHKRD
jgi:galactonate dehydratase